MIVFNGMDLIGLAILAVLFVICVVICGFILVTDRIAYAVKKRQQRRIEADKDINVLSKEGDE